MDDNKDTYFATSEYLERLKQAFPYYDSVLDAFANGDMQVELRKRFKLNAIDERWIIAIENTLPSLDVILRTPGTSLFEHEAILPIEMTKKITSRSVFHLSQHTNMINEIRDDGTVFPSKLLNVFQEDEIYNYENRFINTLMARLYAFVSVRYSACKDNAVDEKATMLKFDQKFEHEDVKGKISLNIEISEKNFVDEVEKNYIYTTDLWNRVEYIRVILNEYMGTKFIQQMGRQYLKPPITRTNKLLKNPDFRTCLDLWEFLESYEVAGYETTIQESVEQVTDQCVKDMYNAMSAEYVIFQYFTHNRFDFANTLDFKSSDSFHPEVKEEVDPLLKDEFAFHHVVGGNTYDEEKALEDDQNIIEAVKIAIAIDDLFIEEEKKSEPVTQYRFSYMARLIQSPDSTKDYYNELKNGLLKYLGMGSQVTWDNEKFKIGTDLMAIMNIRGRFIYLYLSIDPTVYEKLGIKVTDVSDKHQFESVPLLIKVKNDKTFNNAMKLIDHLGLLHSLKKNIAFEPVDYHLPFESTDELINREPPLIKVIVAPLPGMVKNTDNSLEGTETDNVSLPSEEDPDKPVYNYSYEARMIMAPDNLKVVYNALMNTFKKFKNIDDKVTWDCETFRYNLQKLAIINFHGKALYLYLALDPNEELDTKLKHIDVSSKKKFEQTPVLFKLKSERGLKQVISIIESLLKSSGLKQNGIYRDKNFIVPFAPPEELARRNPPLVKLVSGILPEYVEPEVVETIEEEQDNTSYSYSFEARLIQLPSELQALYSTLKNNLLSFKDVKDKMTWSSENYKFGRNTLVQLKIKGKGISIALNADKELFEGIKGIKAKTNEDGTTHKLGIGYKIKNQKTLETAISLIKKLMDSLQIKQGRVLKTNYKRKFMSTEELLALPNPLIKVNKRSVDNE